MLDPLVIPIFPLPNVVLFPQTKLRLHIFEPRYRQMVAELTEREPERRHIGMVLAHAASETGGIFVRGTAGRLTEVEALPDGRSNIELFGDFEFDIDEQVEGKPYHQALVQPRQQPSTGGIPEGAQLLERLVESARRVSAEIGGQESLDALEEWTQTQELEVVVNNLTSQLDLPILRKQQLLHERLPERSQQLLAILRSRQRVLELLRPFRHLSENPESN